MEIEATKVTGFKKSRTTEGGILSDDLDGENRLYKYIDPKSKTVHEGSLNCIAEADESGHTCQEWNDRSNPIGSDAFRLNLQETKMNRTSASVVIETTSKTASIIKRQIDRKLHGTQRGYVGVRFEPAYENERYSYENPMMDQEILEFKWTEGGVVDAAGAFALGMAGLATAVAALAM